jgi:hypothetical protein
MRASPQSQPSSHASLVPACALALLALSFSACGGDEAPAPRVESAPQPPPPVEAAARSIAGRSRSLPPWSESYRRRMEPDAGEDAEEALCVALEQDLTRRLEALFAGEGAGSVNLVGILPERLQPRFEDAGTSVWRAAGDEVVLSPEALTQRLASEPWSHLRGARAEVRVEELRRDPGGVSVAELAVRLVSTDRETSAQLNATWRGRWEGDGSPNLVELAGLSCELITCRAPAFQDITLDVFGQLPSWEEELALGCDAYHQRTEQRVDFFYVGILGVAVGDANGDGLEDLYLSQLGGLPNRLLLHRADGTVEDGGRDAGVDFLDTTRGALFVDVDGDGDEDLCVAREQELLVCWNDGSGKFKERTALEAPGRSPIYSLSAADADGDGDLDLYGCRYPSADISGGVPTPYHDARNGVANVLWRNDGEREFTEVAAELGLTVEGERFSYVSIWEDLDEDGDLDLYVVNDYGANHAFLRAEDGYREAAHELGLENVAAGMGISIADVELDGDLDLYVSNMFSSVGRRVVGREGYRSTGSPEVRAMHAQHAAGNALLLREGEGYREVAAAAGCAPGGWAWGAIFFDWNGDGLPDVYVPNGFISGSGASDVEGLFWRQVIGTTPDEFAAAETYRQGWAAVGHFSQFEPHSWSGHERNYAYLNLGEGEFADVSGASRTDFLDDGRVAVRLDWDGDGALDLLLVNRTGPRLRLLRGALPTRTVSLELVGAEGRRDAIGAHASVRRSDGAVLRSTVYAGEGLLGQSSRRMSFGLGEAAGDVEVEVRWPGGLVQTFEGLAAGRAWRLVEGESEPSSSEFLESPFAARAPSPAPPSTAKAARLVLSEKLPLAQLSLPRAQGGRLALHELSGTPLLICFLDAGQAASRAFLEGVVRSEELAGTGARVLPVQLAGGAADEEWLAELGLSESSLRAARNDEQVLQALLLEVLGAYPDLQLPLSLLCDSGGNLVALHFAESGPAGALRDLRKIKYLRPDDPGTTAVSGGRWLRRPPRQYAELAQVLAMLGARELGASLAKQPR